MPARFIESLTEYAEKAKEKGVPTKNMNAEEKKKYILSKKSV